MGGKISGVGGEGGGSGGGRTGVGGKGSLGEYGRLCGATASSTPDCVTFPAIAMEDTHSEPNLEGGGERDFLE